MNCEEIMESSEFKKCLDFHGHLCPGLAIGFRAAKAALDYFEAERAVDEELVTIVENDACGVDAVQVLTGCTFGKGNLIYKDYGKQVFFFVNRKSGKTLRVAMKAQKTARARKHGELVQKVREDRATEDEKKEFAELHRKRACAILEAPLEEMFSVKEINMTIPDKARITPSEPCARCGEPTMATKLQEVDGEKVCKECLLH